MNIEIDFAFRNNLFINTFHLHFQIKDYTSFESMKKRDNVFTNADLESGFYHKEIVDKDGGFFRKGKENFK